MDACVQCGSRERLPQGRASCFSCLPARNHDELIAEKLSYYPLGPFEGSLALAGKPPATNHEFILQVIEARELRPYGCVKPSLLDGTILRKGKYWTCPECGKSWRLTGPDAPQPNRNGLGLGCAFVIVIIGVAAILGSMG